MMQSLRVLAAGLLGAYGGGGSAGVRNREPIGGPFALTDQNGARRTEADFRGKLMLVYFGFTYCPDICPTDLQQMGLAVDRLGPDGDAVQPIFITVDPER